METFIDKNIGREVRTAQVKKQLERKLIKSMAGTYWVSFKFAETFAADPNYEYYDRHFSQAKEVILLLEETENKISLQHILFVGKHQIKHWRQDWVYENQELLTLVKDHQWKKIQITPEQAKGTWTQKVYQVDDAPRYQGYGTWVHVDGRNYWQGTADAALPRREITTAGRTDYNVLRRHSHIEIFENDGWLLEQDNEKIHRSPSGKETLICMEKGLERFKVKNFDITNIMNWWEEQEAFWTEVRQIWDDFVATQSRIKIKEDQKLYNTQFELAETFSGNNFDAEKARKSIRKLLEVHVENFKA